MPEFTIDDLTRVVQSVTGSRRVELKPEMTAKDVPAWDSLNNTLIAIELSERAGTTLSAKDLAATANMGELVQLVNSRNTGPK